MIIDSPKPISGQALKSASVTGILRYLAKQGGSSVVVGVTAAEVADLNAHGIELALIYEAQAATWMGGGAAAGTQAANWVQGQLNAIGCPNAPVWFAADSNTLSSAAVDACLDAIAAVMGHARVGEYGFAPQVTAGHAGNHADRYWLCGSASGIQSWMNLYQENNTAPQVAGQAVDQDIPEQADWGQIGVILDMNLGDAIPGLFWPGSTNPVLVQDVFTRVFQNLCVSAASPNNETLYDAIWGVGTAVSTAETAIVAAVQAGSNSQPSELTGSATVTVNLAPPAPAA